MPTRANRTTIFAAAILFAITMLLAAALGMRLGDLSAQSPGDVIVLSGGRVLAAPDASVIEDAVVVLSKGAIQEVGPRSRVKIPAGAQTIDCAGMTIVAGFQNSHVHFSEVNFSDAKSRPAEQLTEALDAMLNRYGFTTVVDTASLLANTVELRWRVGTSEVKGPRILTAGLALYPPYGVPYYVRDSVSPELLKLLPQPENVDAAEEQVRKNAEGGANLVKLFTGSWVARNSITLMPKEIATAAVVEAHRRNLLVFAHPSSVAGLEVALDARVDVIAHAVEAADGLTANHLKRMKSQNVALVPTLKLLADESRRAILDQVRDYARIGGQILFGTDVGYLTDYDPAREYELMTVAGLGWQQILASLTVNPASRFREANRRGRVARGLDADLVVLGSDPAQGWKAFTDVRYTIREGRLVYDSHRR